MQHFYLRLTRGPEKSAGFIAAHESPGHFAVLQPAQRTVSGDGCELSRAYYLERLARRLPCVGRNRQSPNSRVGAATAARRVENVALRIHWTQSLDSEIDSLTGFRVPDYDAATRSRWSAGQYDVRRFGWDADVETDIAGVW
jgi:hypothetical protein